MLLGCQFGTVSKIKSDKLENYDRILLHKHISKVLPATQKV